MLKCDGENALKAFRNALAKYHGGIIIPEAPANGESQSNGAAEAAGKLVREFVRVLKLQMEDKAGVKIEGHENIVQWMLRWAAMLVSRYLVGKDGRTALERRKGRRCRLVCVPFAETVWYREVRKTKQRENKLETEMKEGVWLGHANQTNEVLIGTEAGVIRVYDIKRKDEKERWNKEKILNMKGTPRQPDPSKPGAGIPTRVSFDSVDKQDVDGPEPLRAGVDIRRMRITPETLEKHGYTEGCEGCRWQKAGLRDEKGRGRGHPEARRRIITEELQEPEEGKKIFEKSKDSIGCTNGPRARERRQENQER